METSSNEVHTLVIISVICALYSIYFNCLDFFFFLVLSQSYIKTLQFCQMSKI